MTPSSPALRSAVLGVLAASVLTAGTSIAAPGGTPGAAPRNVMQNRGPATSVELPSHAKANSGLLGDFNLGALDAKNIRLTLSGDRSIEARAERVVKDDASGLQSWIGTVDDMPGSMLVVTKYRGVTTGFLTYGTETWELEPSTNGRHLLFEVDQERIPTLEPELFPEDIDMDAAVTDDFGTAGVTTNADGGFVHDLLVVYTPAAREASGQATLESQIQNAVAAANQAYQNSAIDITLNLVGMREVSYTEVSSMQTMLYDLRGTSDGKMDSVHALRDSLGADVVSLVTRTGSGCGYAFSMRSESSSFASSAFNVVKKSCLSNHSLAHEVGHNQGNMHNRESTSNTGAFAYSYGFRRCTTDGTGFRTVMSYSCSGANRVTRFSNPNVNFNGHPTGISYESDRDSSAENARSMNNTADTVAGFRGASGGGTPPSEPAAPSTLVAAANSSTRITVTWRDNSDNETGFRLERSGNGVDYSEVATLGTGTTSYNDSGLSSQTTYYYRARAYNSAGNSAYSNSDSVTTPDEIPPPASPTGVNVVDNADGSATISWTDASSNETSFEIGRETWDARRSRWKGLTMVGSVPTNVTNMVDQSGSGTFRYKVRSVNSGGASVYAGPVEITVSGGSGGGSKGKGGGKGRKK